MRFRLLTFALLAAFLAISLQSPHAQVPTPYESGSQPNAKAKSPPISDQTYERLDESIDRELYSTNTTIHHYRIEGTDLWIPQNYQLGPADDEAVEQRSILLQVLLPAFEPRNENNLTQFTHGLGWQNRSQILLADKSQKTGLEHSRRLYLAWHPSFHDDGIRFGLEHLQTQISDDGGLRDMPTDMYYEERDGRLISFIVCTPLAKDPGCAHHFMFKDVYVEMTYKMTYLPEWRALEQRCLALLESLRTPPAERN